jgi:hypothetical protein
MINILQSKYVYIQRHRPSPLRPSDPQYPRIVHAGLAQCLLKKRGRTKGPDFPAPRITTPHLKHIPKIGGLAIGIGLDHIRSTRVHYSTYNREHGFNITYRTLKEVFKNRLGLDDENHGPVFPGLSPGSAREHPLLYSRLYGDLIDQIFRCAQRNAWAV